MKITDAPTAFADDAARIYELWQTHLRTGNVEALIELYAPDAVIESPLVMALMESETGIIRGTEMVREFLKRTVEHRPDDRVRWHRAGYQWDGKTLFWEYPAQTPEGYQVDLAEVMDIQNGRIQRHRIYWGWYGVSMLTKSARRSWEHQNSP